MSSSTALLLTSKGDVKSIKIPSHDPTIDDIMKLLKRKTAPKEIATYKYEKYKLTLFGYDSGRAGTESKHTLPPPHSDETFYGDLLLVASKKGTAWSKPVNFTIENYEKFYQLSFGEGESEGDDDDDSVSDDSVSLSESEEEEEVDEAEAEAEVDDESEKSEIDEESEAESEGEVDADGGDGDDDEIRPSKPKSKKKSGSAAASKATSAAANTGRFKQYTLVQKGEIEDNEIAPQKIDATAGTEKQERQFIMSILMKKLNNKYISKNAAKIENLIAEIAADEAAKRSIVRHFDNPLFMTIYKNVARRIIGNILPTSYIGNSHLYDRLLGGELDIEMLRTMTIQDMNPGLYKDLYDRQLLREKAQLEGSKALVTDMFQCKRCKKRECTYYQLQTRSADEPMTIFITCMNCGKRWKE